MRGDPPITRELVEHESRLAATSIRRQWESLNDNQKDAYVQRLAANAQEPPELVALLAADPATAINWRSAHFLVRAEFCASINEARFGWQRRWRAKTAIRFAPKEQPYVRS